MVDFPATIADLCAPEKMPADLRAAHDRSDETLERIHIGRRFKNHTERLEKLFELLHQNDRQRPRKEGDEEADASFFLKIGLAICNLPETLSCN
jgi:hypothetical protein